jgi:hypothetical protein
MHQSHPDSHVAATPVSKTRSTLLGGGLIEVGHRDVGAFLGHPGGTGPATAMCAQSTVGLWLTSVAESGTRAGAVRSHVGQVCIRVSQAAASQRPPAWPPRRRARRGNCVLVRLDLARVCDRIPLPRVDQFGRPSTSRDGTGIVGQAVAPRRAARWAT